MVMQDVPSSALPSPDVQGEKDLPVWLARMMGYLRGVSEDAAWQNLVTEFVDFEKRGPPHGVSPILVSLSTQTN